MDKAQRQDLPEVFVLNGAVYIARVEWFNKVKAFVTNETIGYVMPEERSLDIDTEFDILIVDFLLKRRMCERHE
jgi:N-acylneuraminate cytidylyltransferase